MSYRKKSHPDPDEVGIINNSTQNDDLASVSVSRPSSSASSSLESGRDDTCLTKPGASFIIAGTFFFS